MKLPVAFLEKMEALLGKEEFEAFIESYNKPRYFGLRVNTLKISVEEFLKISPFELEPVPWTTDGFYYPEGSSPGKHPYYNAGLYYIQEPSAMLPGQILGAQPGERVLDLCAAPGGKTVQVAAAMKGEGILIANDISADRVKALVKNIEQCGVRNAIVTNETPEKLAVKFEGYFDRIIVDAPCSGEGMFRKDEDAARSWEKFKCEACAGMQTNILKSVDKMLKPGGTLVYSTCTFSPEEDEKMIATFLSEHNNYTIAAIPKAAGIADGRPEWADGNEKLAGAARLWPHRVKGEGHFVAKLCKNGDTVDNIDNTDSDDSGAASGKFASGKMVSGGNVSEGFPGEKLPAEFLSFMKDNLNIIIGGCFFSKGKNLYNLPAEPLALDGLKVAKFGWFLGELINGRFEASHSMVAALHKSDVKRTVDLSSGSREVLSYLKGETVMLEGEKGLSAVCTDGYSLGWAKQTGDMLKNLYPKGWRKMNG